MNPIRDQVEAALGCRARLERIETVVELDDGALAFDGEVHVFAVDGNPHCNRAYAWLDESAPGARLHVVPASDSIDSASAAVRSKRGT